MGQWFGDPWFGWFLAQCFSWDCTKLSAGVCNHLKTWLGFRIHPRDGSLTWMVSWCWLLARCLGSSQVPLGASIQGRLSNFMTLWLASPTMKREGTSHNPLYDLASEAPPCLWRCALLLAQRSPDSVWGDHARPWVSAGENRPGLVGKLPPRVLCLWNMSLSQSQVFKILSHVQHSDQSPSLPWSLAW